MTYLSGMLMADRLLGGNADGVLLLLASEVSCSRLSFAAGRAWY